MGTPAENAALWKANLGGSTKKITSGVNAVQVAPGELAAAQQDLMRRRVLESIDNGTWAANTRAVTKESWKASMLGKGLQNLQTGLQQGEAKTLAYQQMAAPTFAQAKAAAAAIPKDGTDQSALAKVAASMAVMRTLKGRMKGR